MSSQRLKLKTCNIIKSSKIVAESFLYSVVFLSMFEKIQMLDQIFDVTRQSRCVGFVAED